MRNITMFHSIPCRSYNKFVSALFLSFILNSKVSSGGIFSFSSSSSLSNSLDQSIDVPTTNEVLTQDFSISCKNDNEECLSIRSTDVEARDQSHISESSYSAGSPATSIVVERFGSDMGVVQVVDEAENSDEIAKRIVNARRYLKDTVLNSTNDKYSKVRDLCKNQHTNCAFWAALGECEANPAYMSVNCAPVCFTCEMLHVETRCPLDPNAVDAFANPGDLDRMFENIVTDPDIQQYQPVVLSRPSYAPGDNANIGNLTYKADGIWMIMFENIVTDTEANRLIELGGSLGYERSSDVGEEKEDGTYAAHVNGGRTSTNAWCVHQCYTDPIAVAVMERISKITGGIPEVNSENLQLLRYEPGQYYQTHNDYIEYQMNRPCGVRTLTFYIYLNDVEEGGGTNFPKLGLTVTPKKGRAVLWPSVLNDSPNKKDPRSDHQALPVIKGVKYGANAWIHQRDFKNSNRAGCS